MVVHRLPLNVTRIIRELMGSMLMRALLAFELIRIPNPPPVEFVFFVADPE